MSNGVVLYKQVVFSRIEGEAMGKWLEAWSWSNEGWISREKKSDRDPKCHFGRNCRSLTFIPAVPSKMKIARWGTTGLAKVYHWSQEMWGIDAAGQGNSPRIHARPLPINVTGGSRRSFLDWWHTTTDISQKIPSSLDWDQLAGILGFYFANV